ncbi:MAG: hypothetical protein ACM33V_06275 [Chloroflexota bacterium]
MSIEESHQPRYRFNKLTAIWQGFLERVREALPARWLLLVTGLGCLIYSQYMMEQRYGQGPLTPAVEQWNVFYRLEIVNLGSVLAGLPYFAAGLVLCALAGLPSAWKEKFVNWSSQWPALNATKWGKHTPGLLAATGLMIYLLVQLGKHKYEPVYPLLWLLALWVFTLVI